MATLLRWGARGAAGSLEAVEDLALHAMLDLAPPQHELQDFVDGVLRVFLQTQAQMQEHASQGDPRTPTKPHLAPQSPQENPHVPHSQGTSRHISPLIVRRAHTS